MAEFKTIPEADAPRPTRQTGRLAARMREYEKHIDAVRPGRVGVLTPAKGETARGIALRVGRAARRTNKTTSAWISGGNVYFKVI